MPTLCRFGKSVIGVVEDNIEAEEFWIPDEWRLYHEIEELFRGANWIDGGEALDLQNKVEELEVEVSRLEEGSLALENETSELLKDYRDLEYQVSDLREELRAVKEGF